MFTISVSILVTNCYVRGGVAMLFTLFFAPSIISLVYFMRCLKKGHQPHMTTSTNTAKMNISNEHNALTILKHFKYSYYTITGQ